MLLIKSPFCKKPPWKTLESVLRRWLGLGGLVSRGLGAGKTQETVTRVGSLHPLPSPTPWRGRRLEMGLNAVAEPTEALGEGMVPVPPACP